jgi:SAM-dependent methyltransferase
MSETVGKRGGAAGLSGNAASAVFEREWRTYRKMVDNNYLFHREAYGLLHAILRAAAAPFRFLDIACGDAGESARALAGTAIGRYDGIDLSAAALELAARNLAALPCPVHLHRGELAAALAAWREPVDVAWIGLSLHHFRAAGKLEILGTVRRLMPPGGLLLLYENASPDGEDRPAWMRRWDAQRPHWATYSDAEWEVMTAHVHASDFPETASAWLRLGREAGFAAMDELYRTPSDLFRLYRLRA